MEKQILEDMLRGKPDARNRYDKAKEQELKSFMQWALGTALVVIGMLGGQLIQKSSFATTNELDKKADIIMVEEVARRHESDNAATSIAIGKVEHKVDQMTELLIALKMQITRLETKIEQLERKP